MILISFWIWQNLSEDIIFRPVDPNDEVPLVSSLPQMKTLTEDLDEEEKDKYQPVEYVSPQVIGGCLSVTGLPNSRWLALINLKLIKERNKVVDIAPPKQAPFFLPTVAGLAPKFDRSELEGIFCLE